MDLRDLGPVGELEFARLCLEEAGERGLTARELATVMGKPYAVVVGTFMIQLTYYCGVYEEFRNHRIYYTMNTEVDEAMAKNGARQFYIGGNGRATVGETFDGE